MSALATRESPSLTEYKPQGLGHILKLSGIVTAGTLLISVGGNVLFAVPLALATVYQMFRSTGKVKDADWCQSRDELWNYQLSPKHKSLADSYADWCKEWGKDTINSLIEPMIGNCELCNFTQDKQHPYHGLRGILTFDDGESVPLTPTDYVSLRLTERETALEKRDAIGVTATEVGTDTNMFGEAPIAAPKDATEFLRSLTSAPLQPVIIAGLPGSGKGVLAAIALSLGVRERGLRFWIFNPKNKLAEAGYWARAERHYLKDRLMTDESLFAALMATLEEFSSEGSRRNNQPGDYEPFILLLEEITSLIGLFTPKEKQIFKSKLTAVASLLRGSNMAIWLSGQSVTLEDLGFSGRSNRAMFTAIVAVGEDRTGCKSVCDLIAIPFDEASLPPGRCWLTGNAVYPAVQAPGSIPQYPDWASVPNVIDLRPGALAASDEATAISENLFTPIPAPVISENLIQAIAPPTISENLQPISQVSISPKQKLEEAYKLDYAEPTQITEVEPTPVDYSEAHEFLHPLIQYSIKYGWVTARQIKAGVRVYASNPTEEIREFFAKAAETVGTVRGVGDRLQYAALPNETREKC